MQNIDKSLCAPEKLLPIGNKSFVKRERKKRVSFSQPLICYCYYLNLHFRVLGRHWLDHEWDLDAEMGHKNINGHVLPHFYPQFLKQKIKLVFLRSGRKMETTSFECGVIKTY